MLGGHMYLLVEESFAHRAGGARDGRNGLGRSVRHGGGVCGEQLVVSGCLATAIGGEMGGQAVVLMLAQLSDVKLRHQAWQRRQGSCDCGRPHKNL